MIISIDITDKKHTNTRKVEQEQNVQSINGWVTGQGWWVVIPWVLLMTLLVGDQLFTSRSRDIIEDEVLTTVEEFLWEVGHTQGDEEVESHDQVSEGEPLSAVL